VVGDYRIQTLYDRAQEEAVKLKTFCILREQDRITKPGFLQWQYSLQKKEQTLQCLVKAVGGDEKIANQKFEEFLGPSSPQSTQVFPSLQPTQDGTFIFPPSSAVSPPAEKPPATTTFQWRPQITHSLVENRSEVDNKNQVRIATSSADPTYVPQIAPVILGRNVVIGTSQRVKELLRSNPQGHHYHAALNPLLVEVRPTPKSCGKRTADFFRSEMVSTFEIGASSDSCRISDEKVDCVSNNLPGYSNLFLSLTYQWRPTELDLSLQVQQRGMWGGTKSAQLAQEHVGWFENLFDCLVSIVECDNELPVCAQRALRRSK
jgi:hypothetical protein